MKLRALQRHQPLEPQLQLVDGRQQPAERPLVRLRPARQVVVRIPASGWSSSGRTAARSCRSTRMATLYPSQGVYLKQGYYRVAQRDHGESSTTTGRAAATATRTSSPGSRRAPGRRASADGADEPRRLRRSRARPSSATRSRRRSTSRGWPTRPRSATSGSPATRRAAPARRSRARRVRPTASPQGDLGKTLRVRASAKTASGTVSSTSDATPGRAVADVRAPGDGEQLAQGRRHHRRRLRLDGDDDRQLRQGRVLGDAERPERDQARRGGRHLGHLRLPLRHDVAPERGLPVRRRRGRARRHPLQGHQPGDGVDLQRVGVGLLEHPRRGRRSPATSRGRSTSAASRSRRSTSSSTGR